MSFFFMLPEIFVIFGFFVGVRVVGLEQWASRVQECESSGVRIIVLTFSHSLDILRDGHRGVHLHN